MLARLHDETYDHFVSMQGFGPARMVGFVTPKAELLDYKRDLAKLPILINQELTEFSESPEEHELHAKVMSDFFRPGSYGHVISSTRTISFEPHGSTDLKQEIGTTLEHAATWQLTRLELVGLLRHDEPRVYVAETIPLMNELEDIPHRTLNEFEAAALPHLETQRDTVIEETPEGAVMLGRSRRQRLPAVS